MSSCRHSKIAILKQIISIYFEGNAHTILSDLILSISLPNTYDAVPFNQKSNLGLRDGDVN